MISDRIITFLPILVGVFCFTVFCIYRRRLNRMNPSQGQGKKAKMEAWLEGQTVGARLYRGSSSPERLKPLQSLYITIPADSFASNSMVSIHYSLDEKQTIVKEADVPNSPQVLAPDLGDPLSSPPTSAIVGLFAALIGIIFLALSSGDM